MSEDDRAGDEAREPEKDETPQDAEAREPEQDAPPQDAEGPEGAQGAAGGESERPPPPEQEAASPPDAGPAAERPPRREPEKRRADEVVPGADLEPDLVLDERPAEEDRYPDAERYTEADAEAAPAEGEPEEAPPAQAEPTPPRSPMELAADARYRATGKRKTSVARVILQPGDGSYTVNGRSLEEFFPRPTLQKTARQPLAAAGYDSRMDVVARLHGGGVSSQAGALRHGVARALVEADPNLRGELKRRGFLTRDPRVKERKKAGLKKARKRPQFSKR